jgi:integrase
MGFRRPLVRIQWPRHRKGWRDNKLRRPLFLPPKAWVGNSGVARRVIPKDAEGHRQRNRRAANMSRLSAYPWKRENCSCVRIIRGIGLPRTPGLSRSVTPATASASTLKVSLRRRSANAAICRRNRPRKSSRRITGLWPPQRHRDRILTPEERQEILRTIPDQHFRDFVFAMQETGARPGEVRKVTAAHVNLDLGVWVFKEHKTVKRTGRPRIIYLTPAMVELTRRLMEKYPEGPLFRGPRSKRGFTRNGVRCRFRNLRKKLPHLAGVISYTMRHSFATQALVNGVGIAHVAELMGHVDASMVSQHYAHLAGNIQHMREAALKAASNG